LLIDFLFVFVEVYQRIGVHGLSLDGLFVPSIFYLGIVVDELAYVEVGALHLALGVENELFCFVDF